jgi:hypothetical protein
MQFQTLKLGGGGLQFASTNSTRLPFQFPSPIQGAYALLQGFRFERVDGRGSYYSGEPDEELRSCRVSALVLFDALQSNLGGQVQIDFSLPGPTSSGSADLLRAEVDVLVIAV